MKKYKINPNLTYKKISDQIIILDENQAEVRELNTVASTIFIQMLDWVTLEDITAAITSEYDISEKEALQDIQEFANMYVDHEYVVVKEEK